MLRCREITTLVANGELDEAGTWLRMKVRLHLMMCRHCNRYTRQIQAIGAAARSRFQGSRKEAGMEELQRRILDAAADSKKDCS